MIPLPWLWLLGVGALLWLAFREFRTHGLTHAAAVRLHQAGRRTEAIRLLERSLATPSLLGERSRRTTRRALAWLRMEEGDYAAAAEQCQALLAARPRPELAAGIRQQLADCLEGMGEANAAAEERARVTEELKSAGSGAPALLVRGRALDEAQRYGEARSVYEQCLASVPERNRELRAEVQLRLALTCLHAGDPAETVRLAEATVELQPGELLLLEAHAVAALGHSTQGALEESEGHLIDAMQRAQRLGAADRSARLLVQLAGVQMKRGLLSEAIRAADTAAGMSLRCRRTARCVEAESLRLWGRFDQARGALDQARRAHGEMRPATERRSQATIDLGQAWLEAEAGEAEAAGSLLAKARSEVAADPRLALWCDATEVWVQARRGDTEAADTLAARVEEGLRDYQGDPGTRQLCLTFLARAAHEAGRFEASAALWDRYLELDPPVIFRISGQYRKGESLLGMGDTEGARACFAAALEGDLDTHHARMARRKLEALDASPG